MSDTQKYSGKSEIDGMFENAIHNVGIPPCPAILKRFMDEANKGEPDYNRLAGIIGNDVSLSAGLIKTANSPFFGIRQRARSMNEALTVLGLKISTRAVAGIILRNSFPQSPNLVRFWDASTRIAHLSGWLANYLNLPGLHTEDAYTFGLFRDCGIPILLRRFPNYESVLTAANRDTERNFCNVEENEFPTNHAVVGCMLAQSWWLPEEICLAISNHHDLTAFEPEDSKLPELSRKLIATAQLAEHIVQRLLGLSMTQEWSKLGGGCLKLLDMDQTRLEVLYAEVVPVISAEY